MKRRIYLDNAATTRVDDRVVSVMGPLLTENFGNASSLHTFGTWSKEILDQSRSFIGSCIGNPPGDLVFTSGGTESNNFALKGVAFANRLKGNHILVSAIEHDCILNTCNWLESQGFAVTRIPVDQYGMVDVEFLQRAITPKTVLVSVMYANNEIGTIEPIAEIGALCRHHGVLFHSDACQAFGKVKIDAEKSCIDLLTINSHKIYGPKGVGALYIRKGTTIEPLLHGGGQENGYRSTTENLPGVAGFAEAARLCMEDLAVEAIRHEGLRKKLESCLLNSYDNIYFHGHPIHRLPNLLSFSFSGLEGETIRLLLLLDEMGIAVSAGSACSSNGSHNGSHVLAATGLNQFEARGAIRVSMGRFTTESDIDAFLEAMNEAVPQLTTIYSR
jgi:cysteine desulfurase